MQEESKDIIQKIADPPINAVKTTVEVEKEGVKVIEKVAEKATDIPPVKQVKKFWHGLGPGLVTGASDDDPSGQGTYSQAGSQFGLQLLWLAPITFPMMAIIQEMCARIGLVTGRGLASNIKRFFPKWVIYFVALLLFLANTFNIGADLGAMAQATELLLPSVPFWLLIILFTAASLLLQILISYDKYARYLKYLALVLFVYVVTAFIIEDFNWAEVIKNAVIPSLTFSKEQIILICGILGTTISPYLFFWQTSQEVEEQISEGKTTIQSRIGADDKTVKKMRLDVWSGMFLSNLVMFFIIAVCAFTLNANGITDVQTASQAAKALEPLAGNKASLLFAIGILGTGFLAIPILAASASYAISESLGWKEGLNKKFTQAKYFYIVIIASMLIGLVINFVGIDTIKSLIYAAVFNGIVAPVVLIPIVLLSSRKSVMGDRVNHSLTTVIGWIVAGIMMIAALATIFSIL